MSWFWGGKSSNPDPTKTLDSDLKQFLNEQQPKPYVTVEEQIRKNAVASPTQAPSTKSEQVVQPDAIPRESLFQDGRYKHLWKTYVPQEEIVNATTTPVDRVLSAKKDRKSSLHQAAMENCAFEEELKRDCFRAGDTMDQIRARLTMCARETKAFNRCFQLQAKFMQALAYQGSAYSTVEEDERIQMHADKLYHKMMDYEAAVDKAKADGQPIPPLTSVFDEQKPAPKIDEIKLPPNIEDTVRADLKDMPPHERELSARAALQEAKISQTYAEDFFKYTTTLNEGRSERQRKLVAMLGETVGKFLIPDAPSDQEARKFRSEDLEQDFWKDDYSKTHILKSDATSNTSQHKR